MCDRVLMGKRKSHFSAMLIASNGLDRYGFYQWAFYPGMLFQSEAKWWGDWGVRKRRHEGLDICLYQGTNGLVHSLDPTVKIPVLYDGTVVCLIDDYIGQTVFVMHDMYETQQNQLCSIYGHTDPGNTIETATPVGEGEIIATICDAGRRGVQMSSHLHLSIAWIPQSYDCQQLNWDTLHHSEVILTNPLDFIESNYTILPNR